MVQVKGFPTPAGYTVRRSKPKLEVLAKIANTAAEGAKR
jgi:hypothetical protein